MGADATVERIRAGGLIAILRLDEAGDLLPAAEALVAGGVTAVEFTLTTPGAVAALAPARARLGDAVVLGVGTVLSPEAAREAMAAGAAFVVTPTVLPEVVRLCRAGGVPVIPGAFTPTEILQAWELGASLVKVFPAGPVGPRYIRDVRGPFPHIPLVPTGGVTLESAGAFIQAGAVALGVGSELAPRDLVARRAWGDLTARARAFAAAVTCARGPSR